MKAVAVPEPGRLEVVEIATPEIQDYECLVKMRACGLCTGTDPKVLHGKVGGPGRYPFILGHEGVGEVVEVGSKVRTWQVGDLVTDPGVRLPAPYKANCGHFAEYGIAQDFEVMDELGIEERAFRASCTLKIPRDIPAVDAPVLLTLKENYSALTNFGFQPGMSVLLFGDGPVGLGLVSLLHLRGAGWVTAVGHWDDRLARLRDIGGANQVVNTKTESLDAALAGREFDLVIDAVGSSAIIREATRRVRNGGKVCLYGVMKHDDCTLSVREHFRNNTSLHVLQWPNGEFEVHDEVVAMVLEGKVDLKNYYTHVMPVDAIAEAFAMVARREVYKVIITF